MTAQEGIRRAGAIPGRDASAPARRGRPVPRRLLVAAPLGAAFALFFGLCFAASRTAAMISDSANNALQAHDLLHGDLLLHGWIVGDATFYTFELPLYALTEAVVGFGPTAAHIEPALVYTIIAIFAAALAKGHATGIQALVRVGVVLAVLTAPLDTGNTSASYGTSGFSGPVVLLEEPNHVGTSVFILAAFLLIDRAAARRATVWLLCAVLTAGQLGDATIRYVAVATILVVCLARLARERSLRGPDAALAVAAGASVPASMLVRAALRALGGYSMVPPVTAIAAPGTWPAHAVTAGHVVLKLFGVVAPQRVTAVAVLCLALSVLALAASLYGLVRAVKGWATADRADQLLSVAIVMLPAAYALSTLINLTTTREIAAVLPLGAALAARHFPSRWAGWRPMIPVVAAAALIPLVAGGARPVAVPPAVALDQWLEAHHLKYGIGGYWEASSVTLQSENRVRVRAVLSGAGSARTAGRPSSPGTTRLPTMRPSRSRIPATARSISRPPPSRPPTESRC
jgi:hypothetical protein